MNKMDEDLTVFLIN